jgi:hypothetical protein
MLRQGSLQGVIDVLKANVADDYFNCVCITGMVRRGKSRLAKILATGVYPQFTYEENYIGNPKRGDTFRKLKRNPIKSVCWIDEGEKVFSSEMRLEKGQWYLQQLFNQFASDNKTVIICTPKFRRIDPRWRDTHITIWIHIFRRGAAILLKRREIESTLDVWGLETMRLTEIAMRADQFSDERILKNFEANPCSLFYFTFPDWSSKEEKEEYTAWKGKSQQDLDDEFDKWDKLQQRKLVANLQTEQGIARVAAFLNWQYGISYVDIGILCGYSEVSIRKFTDLFIDDIFTGNVEVEALPKKYFGGMNENGVKFLDFAKARFDIKDNL